MIDPEFILVMSEHVVGVYNRLIVGHNTATVRDSLRLNAIAREMQYSFQLKASDDEVFANIEDDRHRVVISFSGENGFRVASRPALSISDVILPYHVDKGESGEFIPRRYDMGVLVDYTLPVAS